MSEQIIHTLQQDAVNLLKELIAMPSFSKEEAETATLIEKFLQTKNVSTNRLLNNVWAKNKYFDAGKPVILLNSHHDTVKPNKGYTLDPFAPVEKANKLFGLGSNDAGGSLVSLIAAFLFFYEQKDLKYNLVLAATAEEEISGTKGVEALLADEFFRQSTNSQDQSGWCAIVGEPTLLNMAVAERGLLVLDCTAQGLAGHAAREEGVNAIYKAIQDITWFNNYQFEKISDLLGPVKMSVTIINAGTQHNVVPHECKFTVDIRVNELYSFEEVLETIASHVHSSIHPRSIRLRSTFIATDHALVKAGSAINKTSYGSPTTSDKALMPFPALKMGPGDSARSHTADEYIFLDEIKEGIDLYIQLLQQLL